MIWFCIAVLVFGLDFFVKRWAEKNLRGKGRILIGKSGCSFLLVHNKGFAGSKMKDKPEVVKVVHALILPLFGILCILMGCFKKGNETVAFGFALILGGGASNLYDRFKKGYVTDYLGLPIAKKLVFNLSDLFIFAGALLAVIGDLKN